MCVFIHNVAHVNEQDRLWKLVVGSWISSVCIRSSEYCEELECSTATLCIKKCVNYSFEKTLKGSVDVS